MGSHAVHFDAMLLAKYLKEIALKREIVHIDDEVVDFVLDENKYIKYITTKKGEEIKSDFVFDCSGFKRLIIGGLYKSKWISYKEHLPMKKAIGFFMDLDDLDEIPPYTESIAMECGWVWKIPIQDRFGCGYVFDSDYITVEEAKEEIIQKFGTDIKWGKEFDFEAGMYETPWVKNCIAIGLSSGFIEPLEATSIMLQVIALTSYLDNNLGAVARKQFYIDRYNDRMRSINGENMEFIYTHYLTQRSTSKFWTEFRDKNKMPERVKELLDECEVTIPDEMFLTSRRKYMLEL
jgi:tryptophan halogenase